MNRAHLPLIIRSLVLLAVLVGFAGGAFAESKYGVIYRFPGAHRGNGAYDLIADSAGNLYGTTCCGGSNNLGTVYKLTPAGAGGSSWIRTVLYSFRTGSSIRQSAGAGSLVLDAAGNLYGVTADGGRDCFGFGCGSVFELTPPKGQGTRWTETNLYIFGTGNPTPAFTTGSRGDQDNLFTCSLVALNVDTGKMAWYYQTSPHDMHDYDSAQTPVLFDGMFQGKMRKMVLTAARNGYYFTLDRVTGEHLVSSKYGLLTNWADRFSRNGEPMRDPSKDATVPGSLVSPDSSGTVNWEPPAFSPSTGLLYVAENNTYSIFYLTDTDPRGSMGLGGREEAHIGSGGDFLTAIDYKTGKAKWRHRYESARGGGGGGVLATAGGLVFAGDGAGSLVAHDSATGVPLWNTRIGEVTNAPQTYLLDGHQYIICATGDRLWSFLLY